MRQPTRIDQAGDIEQQLLRSLQREHRDDQIAAKRQSRLDLRFQQSAALLDSDILAHPVAVGALANHVIEACRSIGIGMERLVFGAEIAREQHAATGHFQFHRSRAEDMARVPEPRAEAWSRLEPFAERLRSCLFVGGERVGLSIDRFDLWLIDAVGAAIAALRFGFLDAARIGQHVVEQFARCLGAMNDALVSGGNQLGQQAAMIDVGMSEDHGRQAVCIERQRLIIQRLDRAGPLEQAAVNQHRRLAGADLHAGAGNGASRAVERDGRVRGHWLPPLS